MRNELHFYEVSHCIMEEEKTAGMTGVHMLFEIFQCSFPALFSTVINQQKKEKK